MVLLNRRENRRFTIRELLFGVLIIGLSLPLLLMVMIYSLNMRKIVESKVTAYQKLLLSQAGDNLDHTFSAVEMIRRAVVSEVIDGAYPENPESSPGWENILRIKELIEQMVTLDNANTTIAGIHLILESGYVISSRSSTDGEELKSFPAVREFLRSGKRRGEARAVKTYFLPDLSEGGKIGVLTTLKRIIPPDKRSTSFLIMMDISLPIIREILESAVSEERMPLALVDNDSGAILLGDREVLRKPDSGRIEGETIRLEIRDGEMSLRAIIPDDLVNRIFNASVRASLALMIVLILISTSAAYLLSQSLTSPLHRLYLCMEQVGQGDFRPRYPRSPFYEMQYLIDRFQNMVGEVETLIAELVRRENEAVEAELHALKAKINPHFLYNSLDVIRGMALEQDQEDIAEMTLNLSRLFRYNIREQGEFTTLEKEIRHGKHYLQIQSYRFGNRIRTFFHEEKGLEHALIPPSILQPLLENAFLHGLEPSEGAGELHIGAKRNGELLILTVRDSGVGMQERQLAEIREKLKKKPAMETVKSARGMENVRLRIAFLCGDEYGLHVESTRGEGTEITAVLPFRRAAEAGGRLC